MNLNQKKAIQNLYQVGAIQFGNFTLKSGLQSPLYIDFRLLFSYPTLFADLINFARKAINSLTFDCITGVPYAAIPYATGIALACQKPLIFVRKKTKEHGKIQKIDGLIKPGQRCLIIEDLTTTGSSILETISTLKQEKINVEDVFIFLDRQQGGVQVLENKGFNVHSIFKLSEVLHTLEQSSYINKNQITHISQWITQHQVTI